MTTAIYFNKTPTQRIARGNSKRRKITPATEMAKPRIYVRKARPNFKIKKLKFRLIIMKLPAKNFGSNFLACTRIGDTEPLSRHLAIAPQADPCPTKFKLKETDDLNGGVSHKIRNTRHVRSSRYRVREYASASAKPCRHPRPNVR